jgi:hypothetical protein
MKKPLSGLLGEKRADTRGGLSKGLGAFRIGRPLGPDNGCAENPFPTAEKNLEVAGCGKVRADPSLGGFHGVAVGRAENQDQQQHAGDQGFHGTFDDEGGNAHGFSFKSIQIGGLPRNAPENALTIRRTRNTTSSNLAIDAANPAKPKKPIYAAISARRKKVKAQPSMVAAPEV